jgi:hypothetical protein
MSNRAFWSFVSLVLLLGFGLGYRLSGFPKLDALKLLNVAGLFYSFLGVLVLFEVLESSARWKAICVNLVAPAILWFHALIPFGAFVAADSIAQLTHQPSADIVGKFFIGFFAYSMIPVSIFQELVVLPKLPFVKRDVETRWQWFGFFLLLSGVVVQLVSAVLGLGR